MESKSSKSVADGRAGESLFEPDLSKCDEHRLLRSDFPDDDEMTVQICPGVKVHVDEITVYSQTVNDPLSGGDTVFYIYGKCWAQTQTGLDFDGTRWLSVYMIFTDPAWRKRGHATTLLGWLQYLAKKNGWRFGITVCLNDEIKGIVDRLGIKEYDDFGDDYGVGKNA